MGKIGRASIKTQTTAKMNQAATPAAHSQQAERVAIKRPKATKAFLTDVCGQSLHAARKLIAKRAISLALRAAPRKLNF
jgi:hypothetical protein